MRTFPSKEKRPVEGGNSVYINIYTAYMCGISQAS
jgi:hypothetical protein